MQKYSLFPVMLIGLSLMMSCSSGTSPEPPTNVDQAHVSSAAASSRSSASHESPTPSSAASPASNAELSSSAALNSAPATSEAPVQHSPAFYTVDHYDPARDAQADLRQTIERAEREHKRILLQIGGDWCGWCKRITLFMESNERIRQLLADNFLIMKVTYTSESPNEEFSSQFPKVPAYPHFFVLESNGQLLHAQGTGELEKGPSYDEGVFAEFLQKWIPPRGQ